jgi:hypothetical protein
MMQASGNMNMDATEQSEPTEQGEVGYVEFCIRMNMQDGSLTYTTEKNGEPAPEQPVSDIGQALKMALDAYKNEEANGEGSNAQFDIGFGSRAASNRYKSKGGM